MDPASYIKKLRMTLIGREDEFKILESLHTFVTSDSHDIVKSLIVYN